MFVEGQEGKGSGAEAQDPLHPNCCPWATGLGPGPAGRTDSITAPPPGNLFMPQYPGGDRPLTGRARGGDPCALALAAAPLVSCSHRRPCSLMLLSPRRLPLGLPAAPAGNSCSPDCLGCHLRNPTTYTRSGWSREGGSDLLGGDGVQRHGGTLTLPGFSTK